MHKPRVLLADDHEIFLEGLKGLIEPEFEVVGMVEDGRALVAAAEKLRPDVIVVDISMPLLNGIDAAEQIVKAGVKSKIVFLTMHPDVTYATRAFDAGALGFVLKHSASRELLTAMREAMRGRMYVTPLIAREVMDAYRKGTPQRKEGVGKLSARQREVLQLLAEGRSAKEAADILCISTRTVEHHKYQMMKDVGIKSSAELVQYAIRHGLVSV